MTSVLATKPLGDSTRTAEREHLASLLTSWVELHGPSTAGYLSVRRGTGSEILREDIAVGHGWEGSALVGDLTPAYCLLKPLLPILLAGSAPHLLDSAIDVMPVDEREPTADRSVVRLPVASLLTHAVGLTAPSSLDWRTWGLLFDDADVAASIVLDDQGSYSDFAAWALLEMYFRAETGRDPGRALAEDVLEPMDLTRDVIVDPGLFDPATVGRIVVPFQHGPAGPVPMLSESCPSELDLARPAFGGVASQRGLADLVHGFALARTGEHVPGMPASHLVDRLLAMRGPVVHDPLVGRVLSFAGGFMSNHAAECFPSMGPETFGHTAGLTLSVVVHDPDRELTAAFYLNGVIERPQDMSDLQSRALADLAGWSDR